MKYFLILISLLLASCSKRSNETLTIATAANVQFAMKELAKEFEDETGVKCEIILGSSGQLTSQIKAGAPYDVFVSANMKYANELYLDSLTTDKPVIYAKGVLVLWTMNVSLIPSLDLISDYRISQIAIANPKTAPYGEAAMEMLTRLDLYRRVRSKIVYGESISQVNQFVISGAAQLGFTAKSVVVSDTLRNAGKWIEIDPRLHDPIEQGAVVIQGLHETMAKEFLDFLLSEDGKAILQKNGYQVE